SGNWTLWEPWELGEVGLAFLKERILPFLRLVGQVKQQRRVARQLLQAGKAVGVRVERGLEEPYGCRALLENLPRPLHRRFLELLQGHHGVDQAHLQRFLGRVLAAQEPDLLGLLNADGARQQRRPVACVEAAYLGPGL